MEHIKSLSALITVRQPLQINLIPLQNIVEKNNEAISKKFDEESESLNKKYQDEYNAANSATIDNIVQDGLKMNLSSTDSGDSDVYWKNLANTDENISLLSESSDKNGYFKVDGSYVFGSSYIQLGTQNYNNKFTFEFTQYLTMDQS